jgi:hypothetical protein
MSGQTSDFKVPLRQWSELGDYDHQRYHELRLFFRQQQKDLLRERRSASFSGEIMAILSYIDHRPTGRDQRCIICGIACSGPFICVNTQQLKYLVGRCKSSINSGFQQMGYEVVRDRMAGRDAIVAIIPELRVDPATIRQWTVRSANDSCQLCFCSVFMPPGVEPPKPAAAIPKVTIELPKPTIRFDFEFRAVESGSEEDLTFPDLPLSFSVDTLSGLDGPEGDLFDSLFEKKKERKNEAMPRSQSGIMGFRFS